MGGSGVDTIVKLRPGVSSAYDFPGVLYVQPPWRNFVI